MAVKFFLLTFFITWTSWLLASTLPHDSRMLLEVILLPGTFAPAIAALYFTWRKDGREAVQSLLGRIAQWQAPSRYYIFALAYMAIIKLAVALAHKLLTGAWPRFGDEPWYLLLLAVPFSMWVQAGEEIGWRGYALPRMARRMGLRPASLLLGVVWALWHLPLFFIQGADKTGQSFPVYALQVTALSVAAAWLWWKTNQSLLLVMLMHAAVNNSVGIVPSVVPGASDVFTLNASLVSWLTASGLWIGAAYFLHDMRGHAEDSVPPEQAGVSHSESRS